MVLGSAGLVTRSRGGSSAGLGQLGSFILHAAIWHVVGQAVGVIFRRYPALGTVAAVLLVGFGVYALARWVTRRARARQRPYDGAGRGQGW